MDFQNNKELSQAEHSDMIQSTVKSLVPKFMTLCAVMDPSVMIQAWLSTPFVMMTSMDHNKSSQHSPSSEKREVYTHQMSFVNFLMSLIAEAYADHPEVFRGEDITFAVPNFDGSTCFVKIENLKIDVENQQVPVLAEMKILSDRKDF
jgi:hypothetical protein